MNISIFQQSSWTNTSRKQCKKLLEIICHLAEDDNGHAMAHKTVTLLWNLGQNDDVPVHIMDLALSAHIKIHDYSCSQVRKCFTTLFTFYFLKQHVLVRGQLHFIPQHLFSKIFLSTSYILLQNSAFATSIKVLVSMMFSVLKAKV